VAFVQARQSIVSVDGDCKSPSVCASSDLRITDPMIGTVDGKNSVFTLSRTPMQGMPVYILKNGIPLRNSVDFRILGCEVVLIGEGIPQQGDVLRALYNVAARTALSPTRTALVLRESGRPTGGDLSAMALREALANELKGSESANDGATPDKQPQSLRMLEHIPVQNGSRSGRVLDGFSEFDGLGDGSRSTALGHATPDSETDDENDSIPISLRMLKKRVEDNPKEPKSVTAKRKIRVH